MRERIVYIRMYTAEDLGRAMASARLRLVLPRASICDRTGGEYVRTYSPPVGR
jgi:hypothetical protein